MRNIETKIDNTSPSSTGRLSAAEFNSIMNDIENAVTTAGITLDPSGGADSDLYMLAQGMAKFASGGVFGVDSGAANAYVLAGANSFRMPKALFTGMHVYFYATAGNSGPSTVNAFSLGAKKLLSKTGVALRGGEILTGRLVQAFYDTTLDSGAGAWRLAPWAEVSVVLDPGSDDSGSGSSAGSTSTRYVACIVNGSNPGGYFTCAEAKFTRAGSTVTYSAARGRGQQWSGTLPSYNPTDWSVSAPSTINDGTTVAATSGQLQVPEAGPSGDSSSAVAFDFGSTKSFDKITFWPTTDVGYGPGSSDPRSVFFNKIFTSPDGVTWTNITSLGTIFQGAYTETMGWQHS